MIFPPKEGPKHPKKTYRKSREEFCCSKHVLSPTLWQPFLHKKMWRQIFATSVECDASGEKVGASIEPGSKVPRLALLQPTPPLPHPPVCGYCRAPFISQPSNQPAVFVRKKSLGCFWSPRNLQGSAHAVLLSRTRQRPLLASRT